MNARQFLIIATGIFVGCVAKRAKVPFKAAMIACSQLNFRCRLVESLDKELYREAESYVSHPLEKQAPRFDTQPKQSSKQPY